MGPETETIKLLFSAGTAGVVAVVFMWVLKQLLAVYMEVRKTDNNYRDLESQRVKEILSEVSKVADKQSVLADRLSDLNVNTRDVLHQSRGIMAEAGALVSSLKNGLPKSTTEVLKGISEHPEHPHSGHGQPRET